MRKRIKRREEPIKPNRPYDWASCYLCGKELKGAGKHGVVKNRNNLIFEGLGVFIRYYVWSVLVKSFIIGLVLVRGKHLISI